MHHRQDNIAGIVITDEEYPQRVAFTVIGKVIDEFKQAYPPATWSSGR